MNRGGSDTDRLLALASSGDASAKDLLLARHRDRLKRMVAVRLDRNLAARVDPSDIVQETLADAARRLDEYLEKRPMPYYPWLRRLALDRIDKAHRRHRARRRSVQREEARPLPNQSAQQLAERLLAANTDPAHAAVRRESQQRVQALLDQLSPGDREVLVLRFLERLNSSEIAAILNLSPGAVRLRLMRALERVRSSLGNDFYSENPP